MWILADVPPASMAVGLPCQCVACHRARLALLGKEGNSPLIIRGRVGVPGGKIIRRLAGWITSHQFSLKKRP